MRKRDLLNIVEKLERQEWKEDRALRLLAYKFSQASLDENSIALMVAALLDEFKLRAIDDPMVEQFKDVIVKHYH